MNVPLCKINILLAVVRYLSARGCSPLWVSTPGNLIGRHRPTKRMFPIMFECLSTLIVRCAFVQARDVMLIHQVTRDNAGTIKPFIPNNTFNHAHVVKNHVHVLHVHFELLSPQAFT